MLSGILETKKNDGDVKQTIVFFKASELSHCYHEKDGRPVFMLKSNQKLYDYTSLEERVLLLEQLGDFVRFGNSGIVDINDIEYFDGEESTITFKSGGLLYIAKFLLRQNRRLRELLKDFIKKGT